MTPGNARRMSRRLHIINPASGFPSYHSAEVYAASGMPGRVAVADLSTTTLAGFVPAEWSIRLTDEAITPLDAATIIGDDAEIVAITGKVSQRDRMIELATAYRQPGRVVVIGGSHASLDPDDVAPYADVLVTGEIEDIADDLFADLAAGTARGRYVGKWPDLTRSPVPRWDLYPTGRAQMGSIQTSRGCPFPCDFCDVIQYLGRRQRHKTPAQVIAELEALYRRGLGHIFLADDNFTVHRRHAHAVLDALRAWNRAVAFPARFMTQTSLDVARDPDLLEACRSAGLVSFYMGLETTNQAGLAEAGKKQNLHQDMMTAVETIVGHGIAVHAGIIAGFDADRANVFDELGDFIDASPIPMLAIGALVAPIGTPLHDRLRREGRIIANAGRSANNPFATNIVPGGMSHAELLDGLHRLCARTYAPLAFERRVNRFVELHATRCPEWPALSPQRLHLATPDRSILKWLSRQGSTEGAIIMRLLRTAVMRPDVAFHILVFLTRYAQTRFMLAQSSNGDTDGPIALKHQRPQRTSSAGPLPDAPPIEVASA